MSQLEGKKNFSSLMPKLSSKGLLVFQSGSFGLRAALFDVDKSYASIKRFAESQQVDFTRAIAEIHQQFKQQHGSVPKHCILISPSLSCAKVNLAVNPTKKTDSEKMQELIRWEMDGTTGDDNKQWLIGSMLVDRGYLSTEQRQELVLELESRQAQGGDAAMLRFGEIAVELGYLSTEQLDECFSLQHKLLELEQNTHFGYQAELSEEDLDSHFSGLSDDVLDSEKQGEHPWLVAGLGQNIRQHWFAAFALNGLKLQAFYPNNGMSFSALGLRSDETEQCLLEVHNSHLVYIEGSDKNLKQISIKARQDGPLDLAELLVICPEDIARRVNSLALYSPLDEIEELSIELADHLNIELKALTQAEPEFDLPLGFSSNALLPFIGAANHYLGFSPQGRACYLPGRDKEPPVWQKLAQPKVLACLTGGVLLVSAIGFIAWMKYNLNYHQQRLNDLEQKWTKESKVKQQIGQAQSEYQRLFNDIDSVKQKIADNDKLLNYLNREVFTAADSVPGVITAIAESINSGVFIENIILLEDNIIVEGRALKTKLANLFANELNKQLKPWCYQVGATDSKAADGETVDGVYLNYKMRLEINRNYFSEPCTTEGRAKVAQQKNVNKNNKSDDTNKKTDKP